MKRFSVTTLATVALALGVWIFFFLLHPERPLSSAELFVVVGGSAGIVVVVKRVWMLFPKRNGRSQEP